MVRCTHADCGWQSIAPSEAAAQRQYADHLVDVHAETVDREIPDGLVEVRLGEDDEWRTMTFEQAQAFHDAVHEQDD
jgi:predicted small metal-binding protein